VAILEQINANIGLDQNGCMRVNFKKQLRSL